MAFPFVLAFSLRQSLSFLHTHLHCQLLHKYIYAEFDIGTRNPAHYAVIIIRFLPY